MPILLANLILLMRMVNILWIWMEMASLIGDGLKKGFENAKMQDNLLFFGELNGDNQVVFRGGRKKALKAGLQMKNGRGRFALITLLMAQMGVMPFRWLWQIMMAMILLTISSCTWICSFSTFLPKDPRVIFFIGDSYKHLVLHIPECCNSAQSVRVVDLDNDVCQRVRLSLFLLQYFFGNERGQQVYYFQTEG